MAGPTTDRHHMITKALIEDISRYIKGEILENEIIKEYVLGMTI